MANIDENERLYDELAARRDAEREPITRAPGSLGWPGRTRALFQAGVVELMAETAVRDLRCPVCRGPVYAPADSDRERVDCVGCDARLVTRRGIDGLSVDLVESSGGGR